MLNRLSRLTHQASLWPMGLFRYICLFNPIKWKVYKWEGVPPLGSKPKFDSGAPKFNFRCQNSISGRRNRVSGAKEYTFGTTTPRWGSPPLNLPSVPAPPDGVEKVNLPKQPHRIKGGVILENICWYFGFVGGVGEDGDLMAVPGIRG